MTEEDQGHLKKVQTQNFYNSEVKVCILFFFSQSLDFNQNNDFFSRKVRILKEICQNLFYSSPSWTQQFF